jgi:hypothetical protein
MDGTFACPECGNEIRLTGLSPGRQVRCGWCATSVEVPFIPRANQIKRLRRSRSSASGRWVVARWWRRLPAWSRAGVVVLSVAIVIAMGTRLVVARVKSAKWEAVARLVESSRCSARSGRLDSALAELEAALIQAGQIKPPPPELDDLKRERDALAVREAEARLAALASAQADADPGRAVGQALTLQARVVRDPALLVLESSILAALERHRLRWAEADSAEARKAFEAGQVARAMELTERQYRTAAELNPEPRRRLQNDATGLARELIARHGTIFEPVRGQFTLGTPESYTSQIRPALFDALRSRGYLPRPVQACWGELWAGLAPFRVSFEVNEQHDDTYFQSPNRVSLIDTRFAIARKDASSAHWQERPRARTAIPVPGLPAYQASRMAVSAHRSQEFERVLYENARTNLLDRLHTLFRNLPPCPSSTADAPGASSS